MTRVYRLVITYPAGSQEPGWQPPGWVPQAFETADESGERPFRWLAERVFLSPGGAKHRAKRLRSFGAIVTVERSEPVTWPAWECP